MSQLEKKRISPQWSGLSVMSALRLVGFSSRVRWDEARPVIKNMIVSARRSGDQQQVLALNYIHSFLKKRLYRTCVQPECQKAIKYPSLRCQLHRVHLYYE